MENFSKAIEKKNDFQNDDELLNIIKNMNDDDDKIEINLEDNVK